MTIRSAMLHRPEIANAWTGTAAFGRIEQLGFRHGAFACCSRRHETQIRLPRVLGGI